MADGTVRCWGEYEAAGTETITNVAAEVAGIDSATQLTAGSYHSCARLEDGTVKCWGSNIDGSLGDGTFDATASPVDVVGISTAVQVDAGDATTCALLADGTIKCWGYNGFGQFGSAGPNIPFYSATPVDVDGITTATQIAVGEVHMCALLADGTIRCWGLNAFGMLGNGLIDISNPFPVEERPKEQVLGISTATQITVGFYHSCALLADGAVKCWGNNSSGELGDGTNTDSSVPVDVTGISDAEQISAHYGQTCASLASGPVKCWGANGYGELGNGTNTNSNVPVEVTGITAGNDVGVGWDHACASLTDGSVNCWGRNNHSQLGNADDTETDSNVPVQVVGIP